MKWLGGVTWWAFDILASMQKWLGLHGNILQKWLGLHGTSCKSGWAYREHPAKVAGPTWNILQKWLGLQGYLAVRWRRASVKPVSIRSY